jgi:hypothetical protein
MALGKEIRRVEAHQNPEEAGPRAEGRETCPSRAWQSGGSNSSSNPKTTSRNCEHDAKRRRSVARIKPDEVVYALDGEFKKALNDTMAQFSPGVKYNESDLFSFFAPLEK